MSDDFDIKAYLRQLTTGPGVYRMLGSDDELLYVGKARNLKRRVSSYFLRASGNPRIEAMVDQIQRIEVTLTGGEDEALLLEANLIKQLAPRYNVLYRDDKSYPYLKLSGDHDYPRVMFYRGATKPPHRYFGPFPSAVAVRETVLSLQKLFRLRPCSDSFLANRQRPCLQHQIGRCSAPCVGLISPEDYAADVRQAERLMSGQGEELAGEINVQMGRAAEALEFERAARLRDQLAALRRVQDSRVLSGQQRDLDLIAVEPHQGFSAVVVMSVRNGMNLGHHSHFPRHPVGTEPEEVAVSFLTQHYLDRPPPSEILLESLPEDADWVAHSLGARHQCRLKLSVPKRGPRVRLLALARSTARQALSARLTAGASMVAKLEELQALFGLPDTPQRMECFDISHTGGERAVASCVVFNEEGPLKSAYRRFNIEGVEPGDDYSAIRQAVGRRYARIRDGEVAMPDLLFIDGGKGQLGAALQALDELGLSEVPIVSVSKGLGRRPGLEQLHLPGKADPLVLPADSAALHLIQQLRDEAHRFAITGHRGRRDKARLQSGLESIEGLGPAKRRALLQQFGGLAQLKRAPIEDLQKVKGISRQLAERIHAYFH